MNPSRIRLLSVLGLLFGLLCACATPRPRPVQTQSSPASQAVSNEDSSRIDWDLKTLTLIQRGGGYGRIIRLHSGALLCCFEWKGGIAVRHSDDEGKTWRGPVVVATWPYGGLANPDLLQLNDGAVLCVYNERPSPKFQKRNGNTDTDRNGDTREEKSRNASTSGDEMHPFAICLARSEDDGAKWDTPVTVFSGSADFHDGCWEPALLRLPSGEVQVYFANETPYRASDEQEISLVRSFDGGRMWSRPETVSFRAGSRDGMPSPLLLRDGTGIALAVEDNGFNGNLQPVIESTSLKDDWRSGPVGGNSPRRWSALEPMLPAGVYAGAPFLAQLPSGATLLSFQQDNDGVLAKSHMVVCVGDAAARNFAHPTYPFPREGHTPQLWNSLFVKNPTTVTALSTTAIHGVGGLWSIDGRIGK